METDLTAVSCGGAGGGGAASGTDVESVLPCTVGVPPNVVFGGTGMEPCWPDLTSVLRVPVTPCTVPCKEFSTVLRTESAKVWMGPRDDPAVGLASFVAVGVPGVPAEPGSADAIAPPALAMSSPEDTRHTPAAARRCVEMSISSQQPTASSVSYSLQSFHRIGVGYRHSAVNLAL